MRRNPETMRQQEEGETIYVISKCWHDEDGTVLSVPVMGLDGELENPEQVAACVAVFNAHEEARFGPDAPFFYSYQAYPRQRIDHFPF